MEAKLQVLAMAMQASRVKGHQWRITSKQQYQKLMVKQLPSLVFLMVSNSINKLFAFLPYQLHILVYNLTMYIGHGGSRTAEYLKDNLFKNLSGHPGFMKDTKTAIGITI